MAGNGTGTMAGYGTGTMAGHGTGTMRYQRTMHVHVKLFSRFREHLPREARGEATLELPDGATVEQLLAHLTITGRVRLITVNDEPQPDQGRILHDGDAIKVFPVVVGG